MMVYYPWGIVVDGVLYMDDDVLYMGHCNNLQFQRKLILKHLTI